MGKRVGGDGGIMGGKVWAGAMDVGGWTPCARGIETVGPRARAATARAHTYMAIESKVRPIRHYGWGNQKGDKHFHKGPLQKIKKE